MAGLVLFLGLSAAAFIVARRFRMTSRRWAIYSCLSGVLIIASAFAAGIAYRLDVEGVWRPAPAGLLEHISLVAGFCWIIAVGVHLLRAHAPTNHATAPAAPPRPAKRGQ